MVRYSSGGAQQTDGAAQSIDSRTAMFHASGDGAMQPFIEVVGPLHELTHLVARIGQPCAQGVEPATGKVDAGR